MAPSLGRDRVPGLPWNYSTPDAANALFVRLEAPNSAFATGGRSVLVLAGRRLGDLHEELDVGPRLAEPVEDELDGLLGVQRGEHAAQPVGHRHLVGREQQLL